MVEVLVALVLLVVMMLGGIALLESTSQGQLYAQRTTRASHLALERLEDLRVRYFSHADLAATVAPCPDTVGNRRVSNPTTAPDSLVFTRYFCVTNLPAGTLDASAKSKQVDMYVVYPAFAGTKTIRMSTIITRVEPWL